MGAKKTNHRYNTELLSEEFETKWNDKKEHKNDR